MSNLRLTHRRLPLSGTGVVHPDETRQIEDVLRREGVGGIETAKNSDDGWEALEMIDVYDDQDLAYRLVLYPYGSGVLYRGTSTDVELVVEEQRPVLRTESPTLIDALANAFERDAETLGVNERIDFSRSSFSATAPGIEAPVEEKAEPEHERAPLTASFPDPTPFVQEVPEPHPPVAKKRAAKKAPAKKAPVAAAKPEAKPAAKKAPAKKAPAKKAPAKKAPAKKAAPKKAAPKKAAPKKAAPKKAAPKKAPARKVAKKAPARKAAPKKAPAKKAPAKKAAPKKAPAKKAAKKAPAKKKKR